VWKDEYYVGTFSEYGMATIRDLFDRLGIKGSSPPAGKPCLLYTKVIVHLPL